MSSNLPNHFYIRGKTHSINGYILTDFGVKLISSLVGELKILLILKLIEHRAAKNGTNESIATTAYGMSKGLHEMFLIV